MASPCHGMLPGAMLTFASDVAEVGLRPAKRSIESYKFDGSGRCTEVESCKTESSRHDGKKDLEIVD